VLRCPLWVSASACPPQAAKLVGPVPQTHTRRLVRIEDAQDGSRNRTFEKNKKQHQNVQNVQNVQFHSPGVLAVGQPGGSPTYFPIYQLPPIFVWFVILIPRTGAKNLRARCFSPPCTVWCRAPLSMTRGLRFCRGRIHATRGRDQSRPYGPRPLSQSCLSGSPTYCLSAKSPPICHSEAEGRRISNVEMLPPPKAGSA
jgi:hypothetical protein